MFENDYIMRQIRGMAAVLARLLFGKSATEYVRPAETFGEADRLHLELVKRIEEGRLEEAENLLFDRLDPADPDTLKVALDFYARLEKLDPAYLSAHGFTEDDIALGLAHAAAAFGHDDAARVFLTFLSEKERDP